MHIFQNIKTYDKPRNKDRLNEQGISGTGQLIQLLIVNQSSCPPDCLE